MDLLEYRTGQVILFQKMAKFADRGLVWHWFATQVDAGDNDITAPAVVLPLASNWVALFTRDTGPRSAILTGDAAVHALSVYIVTSIPPSAVADIGGIV